jgi:CPA1 family monovalent cation:H+ antiporter
MELAELLLGLLAVIAVVVALAPWTRVPHPILLVVIGIAIGLAPGLPRVELDPALTLLVFLPPLLYWPALHLPVREVRANLRPISLLAVGLVVVTMAGVTLLGHAVLGLSWAVAATLGAIVAPPDPVAAVAIAERLGLPQRIVTILEGEGPPPWSPTSSRSPPPSPAPSRWPGRAAGCSRPGSAGRWSGSRLAGAGTRCSGGSTSRRSRTW